MVWWLKLENEWNFLRYGCFLVMEGNNSFLPTNILNNTTLSKNMQTWYHIFFFFEIMFVFVTFCYNFVIIVVMYLCVARNILRFVHLENVIYTRNQGKPAERQLYCAIRSLKSIFAIFCSIISLNFRRDSHFRFDLCKSLLMWPCLARER